MEKQYTKEQLLTHLRHTNPTMYKMISNSSWGVNHTVETMVTENFQALVHEISPIDNGLQLRPESDYKKALKRIRDEGEWIENERTGAKCKTLINIDLTYKVDDFPLDTTRKSYWKGAIAELLGFIRGYTSAADFRALGAKTWDANANENQAWLNNPNRRGQDDMGLVYGAVGNNVPVLNWEGMPFENSLIETDNLDTLEKIVNNLSKGIDDRGEIWNFWSPGVFHLGCLRPCMYSHQFSLVNGTLYMNSSQRSWDGLLGGNYNSVQCYALIALMARITGNEQGDVFHKVVNGHIYDNQWDTFIESGHADRGEFPAPKLWINPEIKTLEDLRTWVTLDDFDVIDYEHHDAISYPMTA